MSLPTEASKGENAPVKTPTRLVQYSASLVMAFACPAAGTAALPQDAFVVVPCPSACPLVLSPAGEFGDDMGPGMIESDYTKARLDASGRRYVTSHFSTEIKVFGPDGSFLNRIGRKGEGPGEFDGISALAFPDDGVVTAFDHTGSVQTFDWTGELLNVVRLPFRPGLGAVFLAKPWAVLQADVQTPERIGLPLHLVNVDNGIVEQSFGSVTGEYRLSDVNRGERVVASGPEGAVWSAYPREYRIELWTPDGLELSLVREVPWFPPGTLEAMSHGSDERPNPILANMAADGSRIWLKLLVADERWDEADASGSLDADRFQDTMIEVIDWQERRVVASRHFDEYYDWLVAPGLIGRTVVTPNASVRYRLYRVDIPDVDPEG